MTLWKHLSTPDNEGLLVFLQSGINRALGVYSWVCFGWGTSGAVTWLPSQRAAVRLHSALRWNGPQSLLQRSVDGWPNRWPPTHCSGFAARIDCCRRPSLLLCLAPSNYPPLPPPPSLLFPPIASLVLEWIKPGLAVFSPHWHPESTEAQR